MLRGFSGHGRHSDRAGRQEGQNRVLPRSPKSFVNLLRLADPAIGKCAGCGASLHDCHEWRCRVAATQKPM